MSVRPAAESSVSSTTKFMAAVPVLGEVVSAKSDVAAMVAITQLSMQHTKDIREVESRLLEPLQKQFHQLQVEQRASECGWGSSLSQQLEDLTEIIGILEKLGPASENARELGEIINREYLREKNQIAEKACQKRSQLVTSDLVRNTVSAAGCAALVGAGVVSGGPVAVFGVYSAACACRTIQVKSRLKGILQELEAKKILEPQEEAKLIAWLNSTVTEEGDWEVLGGEIENENPKA